MDCRELEKRFERLLDGTLPAAAREECEAHLADCPRCGDLKDWMGPAEAAPVDLVPAVLDRTGADPCRQAENRLASYADGFLEAADRELVAMHLARCRPCHDLLAAIQGLALDLPRMAEVAPDRGFVDGVLAATLPPRERVGSSWADLWRRWVQRPRFALEAAYVSALILLPVFNALGSPLGTLPGKAMELARFDPLQRLEAPTAALEQEAGRRLEQLKASKPAEALGRFRVSAGQALEDGTALAQRGKREMGTFVKRVSSLLGNTDGDNPSDDDETNDEKRG